MAEWGLEGLNFLVEERERALKNNEREIERE